MEIFIMLESYFHAYGKMKSLLLIDAKDDIIDQPHVWSKKTHLVKIEVSMFVSLHKDL